MIDIILKRFDEPDEIREFEMGKFEIVELANRTIGRATYQPGWKWANDANGETSLAHFYLPTGLEVG